MKKLLKHMLFILVFLIIVYMLLGTIGSPAQPIKQLIPLPSLEVAPDYRRYPSISNVHC